MEAEDFEHAKSQPEEDEAPTQLGPSLHRPFPCLRGHIREAADKGEAPAKALPPAKDQRPHLRR